jgi:hypothetical protein
LVLVAVLVEEISAELQVLKLAEGLMEVFVAMGTSREEIDKSPLQASELWQCLLQRITRSFSEVRWNRDNYFSLSLYALPSPVHQPKRIFLATSSL